VYGRKLAAPLNVVLGMLPVNMEVPDQYVHRLHDALFDAHETAREQQASGYDRNVQDWRRGVCARSVRTSCRRLGVVRCVCCARLAQSTSRSLMQQVVRAPQAVLRAVDDCIIIDEIAFGRENKCVRRRGAS
jgi:xanthine/CO dehydrogenase XdhC/CoxF family maturation factor